MPSAITINNVSYDVEDIRKATLGAIAMTPDAGSVVDDGDAVLIPGLKRTAVFKTEGKFKVVAKSDAPTAGYMLINKHQLKKTHTVYESVESAEAQRMGQAREPYANRPRFTQQRSRYNA